jgi:hypothetical protein
MAKKWTEEQKLAAKEAYAKRVKSSEEDTSVPWKEQDEVVVVEPVTIQKFEKTDKETPEPEYDKRPMGMDYEHKIQSMTNAVKILPPNMIKDGRHLKENIQAICGFMVTDEMMDLVYKDYVHPDYN